MKNRSYPEYCMTSLGNVPRHWSILPMKRISSIRYGIGEPPTYHPDGIPLIRATNVHAGRLFSKDLVFVNPAEIPEKRIVWLHEGDIVVVRSGAYTGDSAIIPPNFGKCIAGFDMVLRCAACSPQFVQYALLSSYLKEAQIDLERMRAAQPHLNAEELGACRVILPPIDEQVAITDYLDRETAKIATLISKQEKLIELLTEKRQAVISHAVTKGLDPTVPMKPSGVEWMGDVPEHWTKQSLGRITKSKCDGPFGSGLKSEHYTDNGARVIRLQNIRSCRFDDTDTAYIALDYFENDLSTHDVVAGDVLIAGLGDDRNLVGRACVAPIGIAPALVKADCFRFRLNSSAAFPHFIAYQLSSGASVDAGTLSTGSTRSRIPLSVMASRSIVLPPLEEQMQIVAYVDRVVERIEQMISKAEQAIALQKEHRTALISAAVTGKIDVREAVPDLQEAA